MRSRLGTLILIGPAALLLSGCDQDAELLPGTTDSAKQAGHKSDAGKNYDQQLLMTILDDQERLVEQITEAKRSGDMLSIKALFEEFEVKEADFNAGFEAALLSTTAANELSRRHREVTRALH